MKVQTQIFTDLKLKNVYGDNDTPVITFNSDETKCQINDHKMQKVSVALQLGEEMRYETKIWGETVYFSITK